MGISVRRQAFHAFQPLLGFGLGWTPELLSHVHLRGHRTFPGEDHGVGQNMGPWGHEYRPIKEKPHIRLHTHKMSSNCACAFAFFITGEDETKSARWCVMQKYEVW